MRRTGRAECAGGPRVRRGRPAPSKRPFRVTPASDRDFGENAENHLLRRGSAGAHHERLDGSRWHQSVRTGPTHAARRARAIYNQISGRSTPVVEISRFPVSVERCRWESRSRRVFRSPGAAWLRAQVPGRGSGAIGADLRGGGGGRGWRCSGGLLGPICMVAGVEILK